MSKKKTTPTNKLSGVPVVVLTADTLINLIERVNKLEGRLSKAENTAQNNFDCLIDYVPRLQKDGSIMAKCFTDDDLADVLLREPTEARPQ